MLTSLYIENFALIKELSLDLTSGFNVLSGETGAGKSIIIDAINMILGERASTELIRTGTDRAYVEATFSIKGQDRVLSVMKKLELEPEETLIISREITQNKSLAKLNNRSITQSVLRELSAYLFDIHGQHEHQSLLYVDEHLNILDSFGGRDLMTLRTKCEIEIHTLSRLVNELHELQAHARQREKEKEYLQFQIDEIDDAKLTQGELPELEKEQKFLKNAEKLLSKLQYTTQAFDQAEATLHKAQLSLKEMTGLDDTLSAQSVRFDEHFYGLQDIGETLHKYRKQLSFNPERLNIIADRINVIQDLSRKHIKTPLKDGEDMVAHILQKKEHMEKQLSELRQFEVNSSALEKNIDRQKDLLSKICLELSMKRLAVAKTVEKLIIQNLQDLNMPHAVFKVYIQQLEDKTGGIPVLNSMCKLFPSGIDMVEFLISANPGEPPKPLVKVASGGEISRIMLALKSVLADADPIPTMVFDEIDTGIGGRTARAVGEKLLSLAAKRQVICVTHLPQIASLAEQHMVVEKTVEDGTTRVSVRTLRTKEERTAEIARMLSGTESDATLQHAAEILKR